MIKKKKELLKKELTFAVQIFNPDFRDQSGVTSSSACAELSPMLFRAVKSSISRIGLLYSSALHCSLLCERPGSRYGRAVFIGDELAE
jgi:hypothetical protein